MRSAIYKITFGLMTVGAVCLSGRLNQVYADPATQPASQPTTAAVAITWDTAAKHVGETVTVSGPVMGTHSIGGGKSLILNVGKDFPDAGRLTILIKGETTEDDYKDKTVTVTGKVELFKDVPEIKVKPADVTIAK